MSLEYKVDSLFQPRFNELERLLNDRAGQGWQLEQVVQVAVHQGGTKTSWVVFKREVEK